LGMIFVISGGSVFGRLFKDMILIELLAGMVASVSFIFIVKDMIHDEIVKQPPIPTSISFPAPASKPVETSTVTPPAPVEKTIEPKTGESFRDTLKDGSLGPEFVQIPGGTFRMGSDDGESNEKPVHLVTVKSFALGKYEVTRGEFRKFVEATSYKTDAEKRDGCYGWTGSEWKKDSSFNWKNVGFTQDDKHPVVCVSWNDAKAYVNWLSEQTGKDYRLPTEAQWEYACRAGSTGKYSFGDDANQLGNYGWYSSNSGNKTHPVGEKQPNKFGLYDMHGNVWEWLEDAYHRSYNGAPSDGSAWISGNSNYHLLRGGSWGSDDNGLRCAYRNRFDTSFGSHLRGGRFSRVNL